MGNFYSIDHIADDHMYTGIRCNTEEPQLKYRLGTVSNRLLECVCGGGLNMLYRIQNLALSFCNGLKHLARMKVF